MVSLPASITPQPFALWPGMFAVGHSTLYRSATCEVFANCDNKTYAYSCSRGFKIRDWFRDPLDIGVEAGGTLYRINADWGDTQTGGGSF